MKPARLIAILAMVGVLGLLLALPLMLIGAFGYGISHMSEFSSSNSFRGQNVKPGVNDLSGTYDSIGVGGPMDLEWVKDSKPSFTVEGPPENVALVTFKLDGGSLRFGSERGTWKPGKVKITVRGAQPDSISLAGSGSLVAKQFDGGNLDLSLAGSGSADLAGKVSDFEVSIAGSGNVAAKALQCDDCSVSIAGSGDMEISATKSLDVSIAGSGDITYYGDPQVDRSVMGSGKIRKG